MTRMRRRQKVSERFALVEVKELETFHVIVDTEDMEGTVDDKRIRAWAEGEEDERLSTGLVSSSKILYRWGK
jgi:hypothetical protein